MDTQRMLRNNILFAKNSTVPGIVARIVQLKSLFFLTQFLADRFIAKTDKFDRATLGDTSKPRVDPKVLHQVKRICFAFLGMDTGGITPAARCLHFSREFYTIQ